MTCYVTGVYAIHAPASALNNGESEDITATVKSIRTGAREYAYVSAQAVRYWLRSTVSQVEPEWQSSPIERAGAGKKQQSYTAGDPLEYWDDDLFGYMRAVKEDVEGKDGKPKSRNATTTRTAPFRTSTLVSAAPVEIVRDFGVMSRGEGDPVLHGHEFYRAVLVGMFSIDLARVGTFTYADRSGLRNLNDAQIERAERGGLACGQNRDHEAYRLPWQVRARRVSAVLRALGRLDGGAKQSLHFTDVAPAFVCAAVMRGANNPFQFAVTESASPAINFAVIDEAFAAYASDFASHPFVGLRQGFIDSAREGFEARGLVPQHPRTALDQLAAALESTPEWWE